MTDIGKILAILCLIVGASGCAAKKAAPWRPGIAVHWSDISTHPTVRPDNGYRILSPKPTQGLFPTSIAVTRIAVEGGHGPLAGARAVLTSDPHNEHLQWNTALEDQLAVSEVFPIVEANMGGGPVEPRQILAASFALKARLGLIYAVNEPTELETEMMGVLYDTKTAKPLAVLHARATSRVPQTKKAAKRTSAWKWDSDALVRGRFELLLNRCIHEMIKNDFPVPTARATSYRSLDRARSTQWPPRRPRNQP